MALRVAIVGPGALGRALGGVLECGGARVCYLGRARDEHDHGHDLALLTVKAYDTEEAIRGAAPLLGDAPVVSLQNGIGNVEALARVIDTDRVFGGSTTHAARRLPSGEVEHVAEGETRIAPYLPGDARLARHIAARLTEHGLATEVAPDLRRLLWQKLVVSCGVNAVTALRGLRNGELLDDPDGLELAVAAGREARDVARALGIKVEGDPRALVEAVLARTAENRSSMLQDLEAGRPTEVDEINGALVRAAQVSLGRQAPVNAELVRLVKERTLTHA